MGNGKLFIPQLVLGTLFLLSPTLRAGEKQQIPPTVKKAETTVGDYLTKIGGNRGVQIQWIDNAAVRKVFPQATFFAVRYRQFPVGFAPPEGLSSSNVFAVSSKDKVTTLTTEEQLKKYYLSQVSMPKLGVDQQAKLAVISWLALTQELVQDGFYKFEILTEGIQVGKRNGKGRLIVARGGNGEISVNVGLDVKGKPVSIGQQTKVIAGPRPRCQATKLLDADPIVRYMAETELRFMGQPARTYLLEQRAKANSQLRREIDRMLKEITTQGW